MNWWETAQPGDDFQDDRGEWFRVVCVGDEYRDLCAVPLDGIDEGYEVTSFLEAQLAKCAPDHVESMRRALERVVPALVDDTDMHKRLDELVEACATGSRWVGGIATALKTVIPDDWQPPGGGS